MAVSNQLFSVPVTNFLVKFKMPYVRSYRVYGGNVAAFEMSPLLSGTPLIFVYLTLRN